jgi:GGDEF domain-containing protein
VGPVTVSVGVALGDPARGGQGDLIRRADRALYAVKQSGKNSFELAGPAAESTLGARSAA